MLLPILEPSLDINILESTQMSHVLLKLMIDFCYYRQGFTDNLFSCSIFDWFELKNFDCQKSTLNFIFKNFLLILLQYIGLYKNRWSIIFTG